MNETTTSTTASPPSYDDVRSLLGILNGYLIAHEATAAERDPKEFPYVYGQLVMTVGYLTGTPSGGYDRGHVESVLRDPKQVGSLLERMLSNTIEHQDEDVPIPPGSGYSLDDYREDLDAFEERMQELSEEGKDNADMQDYESASYCFKDLAQLKDIYESLECGDYDVATHLIDRLDTAVREEIPQRLYDRLQQDPGD